jgi:hypothetical protein
MKRILLSFLLTMLVLASCSSKKNITSPTGTDSVTISTQIELPTPGSQLSIGHALTLSEPNLIRPYYHSVRDEVKKTTLSLEVDSKGNINADCITDPDTLRIPVVVRVPVPSPCPEPLPIPKRKSRTSMYLLAFSSGVLLMKLHSKYNFKKLYDRFKNFISSKFRR